MGYGVCVYIVYDYRTIFKRSIKGPVWTNRTKAARRLNGHFSISVHSSLNFRKLSAEIVRSPSNLRPNVNEA